MESAANFLERIQHPIRFKFFLLTRLPAAFFSGVKLRYADHEQAKVSIRYGWFTKNPFRSTYFACLSMAAEMSTGILAWMNVAGKNPAVSMLVIKSEAIFHKKAKSTTIFTCEDGRACKQAVDQAFASGKSTSFAARSVGKDENGEIVAEFVFTWSFKAKSGTKEAESLTNP